MSNSWRTVKLKDVTVDIKSRDPSGEPEFTYVDISSIDNKLCEIVDAKRLPGTKAPSRARRPIKEGDVLFSNVRTYLRNVAQVNGIQEPAVASTGFTVLRPTSDLDSRFLYHLARSDFFIARVTPEQTGTHYPATSDRVVRSQEISLPPMDQQKTLANLIDRVESIRRSAAIHAYAAHQGIERFEQSVLAAACSGRLTSTWRDHNASRDMNLLLNERAATGIRKTRRGVVPEAPLRPLLTELDLPAMWTRITVSRALVLGAIEDVKDGNHGANHPKVSEFTLEGLPFIAANLVHDGKIDFDSAPRVSGKALERLRVGFAKANDVIITHKASVGRVAISDRDCILTPQTTYYRCDSTLVLPEYLAIYLQSLYFYLQLAEEMSQTTRDFVPISDQYLLGLIVPPPEEQEEIVRRVKSLLAVANTVDSRIKSASHRIGRSAQAALTKAFRGELPGQPNAGIAGDLR